MARYLARLAGREPRIDENIPAPVLCGFLLEAATALARGLIRYQRLFLVGRGVRIINRGRLKTGRLVRIGHGTLIDAAGSVGVELGDGSRLGIGCIVTTTGHLSRFGVGFVLGERSGLGDYCHVGAAGGVRLGRDVIVGPFVSFHSQEHSFDDPSIPIRLQPTTEEGINVGDNCWIGAKATILDGTTLGAGSVVAAGAVVRGSFPERSLLAGVPARVVRTIGRP